MPEKETPAPKHPAPSPDAERRPTPYRFTDWAAI